MMKRILLAAAILGLLGSTSAFAAIELKLAHSSPATVEDKLEYACIKFKEFVEKESKGEIKVTTYPASQLGQEREQLEGVQMGTIEMCAISTGPIPGLYPEIMLLDIPYLFPDRASAHAFLDGPFGGKISDGMLKKTGVRFLAYGENGFRCFTSNKPLAGPADFKGNKFRSMENPMYQAMFKEMGAIPATIPFGEVYTALAQGVVDGQENPISLITSSRFYEVQKNLLVDNHVFNPHILMINEKLYQGLSPEHRKIIDEGSSLFAREEREFNETQSEQGLQIMRDYGTKIIIASPEVLKQFKDATMGTHKLASERFGAQIVTELQEAVAKAIADTRKK